jgi:hypothetical protein
MSRETTTNAEFEVFKSCFDGVLDEGVGAVALEMTIGATACTQIVLAKDLFIGVVDGVVSDVVVDENGILFRSRLTGCGDKRE